MNLTRSQAEEVAQVLAKSHQIKEHQDDQLVVIQQTCTHPWPITSEIDGWRISHCPLCDHHLEPNHDQHQ